MRHPTIRRYNDTHLIHTVPLLFRMPRHIRKASSRHEVHACFEIRKPLYGSTSQLYIDIPAILSTTHHSPVVGHYFKIEM